MCLKQLWLTMCTLRNTYAKNMFLKITSAYNTCAQGCKHALGYIGMRLLWRRHIKIPQDGVFPPKQSTWWREACRAVDGCIFSIVYLYAFLKPGWFQEKIPFKQMYVWADVFLSRCSIEHIQLKHMYFEASLFWAFVIVSICILSVACRHMNFEALHF